MGGPSDHAWGGAADIYLNSNDATHHQVADAMFDMFSQSSVALGVDHVIWNRQIWSTTKGGPRRYTGSNPHTDHVHVSFTRAGSQAQPNLLITLLTGIRLDIYGEMTGEDRAPRR